MTVPAQAVPVPASHAPCRLCRAEQLTPALTLERAPHDVSYLLTPEQAENDAPIRLDVFRCDDCGHVQLDRAPEETYYEDYLMTVSHSPQMHAFQCEQASDFVGRFGL